MAPPSWGTRFLTRMLDLVSRTGRTGTQRAGRSLERLVPDPEKHKTLILLFQRFEQWLEQWWIGKDDIWPIRKQPPPVPGEYRWQILGESVQGAQHARLNTPNQDSLAYFSSEERLFPIIMAVADGHGSSRNFRSADGSRLAVEITIPVLQLFCEHAATHSSSNRSNLHRIAADNLPRSIVRQWQAGIKAHIERHPFTAEELGKLDAAKETKALKTLQSEPQVAYGTTLLAAALTRDFVLFLQLGDGDILTVDDHGRVQRPIAKDPTLLGNETTSLCTADAELNFRVTCTEFSDGPPALILLATDGYANSFRDEAAFLKVGTDYLKLLHTEGLQAVRANLRNWLQQTSQQGSGDDITLGFIWREGRIPRSQGGDNVRRFARIARGSNV